MTKFSNNLVAEKPNPEAFKNAVKYLEDLIENNVQEKEFRLCQFCGCNTNARLRRCCEAGYEDDLVRISKKPAKT